MEIQIHNEDMTDSVLPVVKSEDVKIKIISHRKDDAGLDSYKVKYVKYFWIQENDLGDYKEFVNEFLEQRDKKVGFDESLSPNEDIVDEEEEEADILAEKPSKDNPVIRQSKRKVAKPKKLQDSESDSINTAKGKDGRFYCPKCPKSFKRPYDFRMHEGIHSGTNPHHCKICDVYFPRASKLTNHLKTKLHQRRLEEEKDEDNDDDDDFIADCIFCSLNFDTEGDLQRHQELEHADEPPVKKSRPNVKSEEKSLYACDLCLESFTTVSEYKTHSKEHSENVNHCKICDVDYSSTLSGHITSKIHNASLNKSLEMFTCPECEKSYHMWESLSTHLDEEHKNISSFCCKRCSIYFDSRSEWIAHLSTVRHTRPSGFNFKASCCEKGFKTFKACSNHERVHTRTSPYHCESCDRYFLKKHHLTSHMVNSHNSDRPYACPYCTRSYKTSSQLENHLEAGHSFQCVTCSKEFSCQPHLKDHLQELPECRKHICTRCNNSEFDSKEELSKHRAEIHEQKSKKTFTCTQCGKTYCEAFKLRQHMEWHSTGRYPFQCDKCTVICYKKSMLEKHINRVHLKLYDYDCKTCGQEFKSKKNLDQHMLDDHQGSAHVCPICDKVLFSLKTFETHQLSHTKVSSLLNIHNKMKDEFLNFGRLTDLSMGLDSSEGLMKNKGDTGAVMSTKIAAGTDIKIPSIMTTERLMLLEDDEEDEDIDMDIGKAVSVITSPDQEDDLTVVGEQDGETGGFKFITSQNSTLHGGAAGTLEGLFAQRPVTIKVASSYSAAVEEGEESVEMSVTSDTIQQLKSTLSDLLSVTLQEPYMSVNEEGEDTAVDGDKIIEIVLVPNLENLQPGDVESEIS